ncbi:MAG: hypothetical protein WCG04_05830 [Alphaproteobacteria bacterium]
MSEAEEKEKEGEIISTKEYTQNYISSLLSWGLLSDDPKMMEAALHKAKGALNSGIFGEMDAVAKESYLFYEHIAPMLVYMAGTPVSNLEEVRAIYKSLFMRAIELITISSLDCHSRA